MCEYPEITPTGFDLPDRTQTRGSELTPADICRANGWQVGTVLVGPRDSDQTRIIVITAIGEQGVFARRLGHPDEHNWCFAFRDWLRIG